MWCGGKHNFGTVVPKKTLSSIPGAGRRSLYLCLSLLWLVCLESIFQHVLRLVTKNIVLLRLQPSFYRSRVWFASPTWAAVQRTEIPRVQLLLDE